jgi:uncharacterized membrane protein YecN with MAPEG domain
MTVTPIYAGLLAIVFVLLSARVILGRFGPGNPSLGDGGNLDMLRRIRGHANFAEYVPLTLRSEPLAHPVTLEAALPQGPIAMEQRA